MLFSIIVPVYNKERYLRECLDTIIHQDFTDYELILVDDGSSDASPAICDSYAAGNARIHCIHQINQGPSAARNAGLKTASGEWVVFVDGDDRIVPDFLSVLKTEIRKVPAELYTFNARKFYEGKADEKLIFNVENRSTILHSDHERFLYLRDRVLLYLTGWEACFALYNRKIIVDHQIQFHTSLNFAEDLLFRLQYLFCIHKIREICNILYEYRQSGDSLLHSACLETLLPKLNLLACEAYAFARKSSCRWCTAHFEELYFYLINFHLKCALRSVPIKLAQEQLYGCDNRMVKKWLRMLGKNRNALVNLMGDRPWIKKS